MPGPLDLPSGGRTPGGAGLEETGRQVRLPQHVHVDVGCEKSHVPVPTPPGSRGRCLPDLHEGLLLPLAEGVVELVPPERGPRGADEAVLLKTALHVAEPVKPGLKAEVQLEKPRHGGPATRGIAHPLPKDHHPPALAVYGHPRLPGGSEGSHEAGQRKPVHVFLRIAPGEHQTGRVLRYLLLHGAEGHYLRPHGSKGVQGTGIGERERPVLCQSHPQGSPLP